MTDKDQKEIEELIYWLNWTAAQQAEIYTEIIFPLNSPLLTEILINLN